MHFKKAQEFDKNFKFHSAYNNFVPICIFKKKKKYAILQFSLIFSASVLQIAGHHMSGLVISNEVKKYFSYPHRSFISFQNYGNRKTKAAFTTDGILQMKWAINIGQ